MADTIIKVDREGFALVQTQTGEYFVGAINKKGDIIASRAGWWYGKNEKEKALDAWKSSTFARATTPEKWLNH